MICQSVKEGRECVFMTKKGCAYNGGGCYPVVDKCEGCDRIEEYPSGSYCGSYAEPSRKWVSGSCNFATHIAKEMQANTKKVNALKASKKRAAGKM